MFDQNFIGFGSCEGLDSSCLSYHTNLLVLEYGGTPSLRFQRTGVREEEEFFDNCKNDLKKHAHTLSDRGGRNRTRLSLGCTGALVRRPHSTWTLVCGRSIMSQNAPVHGGVACDAAIPAPQRATTPHHHLPSSFGSLPKQSPPRDPQSWRAGTPQILQSVPTFWSSGAGRHKVLRLPSGCWQALGCKVALLAGGRLQSRPPGRSTGFLCPLGFCFLAWRWRRYTRGIVATPGRWGGLARSGVARGRPV